MALAVPQTISAGVNFGFTVWRPEFSGAEWSAHLMLRGPAVLDIDAVRDGALHRFSVLGAITAAWVPGEYAYTIRATNGADVLEVESGRARVFADVAAASAGYDGRSPDRVALDAIDAVIAKRATVDQASYRINNRELERTPIADLLRLRAYYRDRVRSEKACAAGNGNPFGRKIRVSFAGGR